MTRFLSCVAAALLFSRVGVQAAEPDYVMIQPGNEWTFHVASTAPGGATEEGMEVVKIGEKVERNGKEYFKQTTRTELKKSFESAALVRVDDKGVYTTPESPVETRDSLEKALPLKVGEAWKTFHLAMVVSESTVVAQEDVPVGGKLYRGCLHIKKTSRAGTTDTWLAPGIGMVKSEAVNKDGSKFIVSLREFAPGESAGK